MFLIIPITLFALLFFISFGQIPYLDGNIDFLKAYDFYQGGFANLFTQWNSVHPPLKETLLSTLYHIFGMSPFVYSIAGFIIGIIGLISMYHFARVLCGEKTARSGTLLLATYPLYLSTGIFTLTDYLLTALIISALFYYIKKRYILFALIASLCVLTKETAILLPLSVILVEITPLFYRHLATKIAWRDVLLATIPLISIGLWFFFLQTQGKGAWSDWNFSSVHEKGTLYTIIHNVITLELFNKYAYHQWLILFVLNWNWIISLICLTGLIAWLLKKRKNIPIQTMFASQRTKTIVVCFLFSISYVLLVLSFQTFAIPRYALPIIPFILVALVASILYLTKITKFPILYLVPLFAMVICVRLFSSIDPISKNIWGRMSIMGDTFYALPFALSGSDGITYNMQYNFLVKKRTEAIILGYNNFDCYWLFPDPENDTKTLSLLDLEEKAYMLCQ